MKLLILTMLLSATTALEAQAPIETTIIETKITRTEYGDNIIFQVSHEANVAYYVIEASTKNDTFQIIAKLDSKGNSTISQKYDYQYQSLQFNYYRIRVVNMNGALSYSKVLPAQPLSDEKMAKK